MAINPGLLGGAASALGGLGGAALLAGNGNLPPELQQQLKASLLAKALGIPQGSSNVSKPNPTADNPFNKALMAQLGLGQPPTVPGAGNLTPGQPSPAQPQPPGGVLPGGVGAAPY